MWVRSGQMETCKTSAYFSGGLPYLDQGNTGPVLTHGPSTDESW